MNEATIVPLGPKPGDQSVQSSKCPKIVPTVVEKKRHRRIRASESLDNRETGIVG